MAEKATALRVLNVGGGSSRDLPAKYAGWHQDLLDIDPEVKPDVCCDAKEMANLDRGVYDAVYCSHNLEHFYQHEVPIVLAGFSHVLKEGGAVDIAVPNVMFVVQEMLTRQQDIDDVFYRVAGGAPVRFHDVLYGWNVAMSQGNLFYAHKCGFSPMSLGRALQAAEFERIEMSTDGPNIFARGTKPCR